MTDHEDVSALAREEYCYVTSTGRVTGKPHPIEIWFGMAGWTIYLLAGDEKSDWVKNMRVEPQVTVKMGKQTFKAQARIITDMHEDALARELLASKYQNWKEGLEFSEWARTGLPMAIDLMV